MALTRSQIERLGGRLVAADEPADDDLALLHELLLDYDIALRSTLVRVNTHVGILPTARIKNTGTILEKLRRHGGSWLKSIQDIAGMRIVQPPTAEEQDAMVRRLVSLFADERRQPRVIDRRARPKHGYTAVHVVVYPRGIPVEIQVRTPWQHLWAEQFEKLADIVGRGIRYGEPPDHWWSRAQRERATPAERAMYDKQYAARVKAVAATQRIADQVRIADESADGLSPGSAQLVLVATIAIHDIIVIRPLSTPTTITP